VEVVTQFGPGIGTQLATFDGSLEHFENAIAGARTFGFARDAVRLRSKGRAAHIDPNSVLVFRDDGSLALPAKPATENELAAHKLLDLLGDALLYGALPRGRIYARCPGHTNNHAMFERALQEGVIVDGSLSSHSYVFKDSAACTS
jgi:UDP-3-O-acyl-N-acetylglucosamine deacetylase